MAGSVRIRPKAGAGNDTIDIGATVGQTWPADVLTLTDGSDGRNANIQDLDFDNAYDELATGLATFGQSRDDVTSGFISVDIAAIALYGTIEDDYSDERIVDSASAKAVGDVQLAIRSAGNVSISGTIIDESKLLEQNPKWNYAVWGDFVWGGRPRLHAGDLITLNSADMGISGLHEIVSLTRRSGDPTVKVTFDWHGWRRSDMVANLGRRIEQLTRALNLKLDTQAFTVHLVGTTAQEISFVMRGMYYREIYIDITSPSWAGTVTIAVYRSGTYLGQSNYTADASGIDTLTTTNIFTQAATYRLVFTPTATVTVTYQIRPVLMG